MLPAATPGKPAAGLLQRALANSGTLGRDRGPAQAGNRSWVEFGPNAAIGVSMVGEMANSIAEVLAERLKGVRFDRPWVRGLSALVKMVARDQASAPALDITRRTRDHRRVFRTPWLWPCHWIPSIEAALTNPAPESCAVLEQFFRAVAGIRHLLAGRQIKHESEALFEYEYPFAFVALAHISGRSRSLTPPPGAYQARDISDVEARLAWELWRIADCVHKELLDLLVANGVAKTCRHCDLLLLDMKRLYCSGACRRAYQNAKDYRRRQTEKR